MVHLSTCFMLERFWQASSRSNISLLGCYTGVNTGYYAVLPSITRYYQVLQGITRYYTVLRGITRYYKVLRGITRYYWESCTRYYAR